MKTPGDLWKKIIVKFYTLCNVVINWVACVLRCRKGRPGSVWFQSGWRTPRAGCSTPSWKCTHHHCQNLRHHLRQGCPLCQSDPCRFSHLFLVIWDLTNRSQFGFLPKINCTGLNHVVCYASVWLLSAFGLVCDRWCRTGQVSGWPPTPTPTDSGLHPPPFQPHVSFGSIHWYLLLLVLYLYLYLYFHWYVLLLVPCCNS